MALGHRGGGGRRGGGGHHGGGRRFHGGGGWGHRGGRRFYGYGPGWGWTLPIDEGGCPVGTVPRYRTDPYDSLYVECVPVPGLLGLGETTTTKILPWAVGGAVVLGLLWWSKRKS